MNGLQVNLPKHPWSSKVHKATSPLVTSHQSPNSLTCMHARIRPVLSTIHCFSLKTKTVRSQQNKWMKIRSINQFCFSLHWRFKSFFLIFGCSPSPTSHPTKVRSVGWLLHHCTTKTLPKPRAFANPSPRSQIEFLFLFYFFCLKIQRHSNKNYIGINDLIGLFTSITCICISIGII